jgi:hypothetical protein
MRRTASTSPPPIVRPRNSWLSSFIGVGSEEGFAVTIVGISSVRYISSYDSTRSERKSGKVLFNNNNNPLRFRPSRFGYN